MQALRFPRFWISAFIYHAKILFPPGVYMDHLEKPWSMILILQENISCFFRSVWDTIVYLFQSSSLYGSPWEALVYDLDYRRKHQSFL